jgi:hypothetical protein
MRCAVERATPSSSAAADTLTEPRSATSVSSLSARPTDSIG